MVSLVVTDITERKSNEAALRESENRFQIVARTSSDVIWDWDLAKNRVWRSEGFMKLFRYGRGEVKDTFEWWEERIHPEHRKEVLASLWAAVNGRSNDLYTATYPFLCGDGSYTFISDCGCVLRDANQKAIRVIGSRRDISKQIEAEQARLGLSRSILNAQEQERQRVARDLHDSVNQLLASANYRLNSIVPEQAGAAAGTIREARELVEKAIAEVRFISRNLRPGELDDLGLVSALRSLTRDFQRRSDIAAHFQSSVSRSAASTSKEVEMTLYRIAQEALNNVEKHSRATRVDVRFKRLTDHASLLIQDNGKGMPQSPSRGRRPGWGLHNMAERAALLDGRIEIESGSKRGTAVTVLIPLNSALEKHAKPCA
jgi:PAS domain S-box-containing protein